MDVDKFNKYMLDIIEKLNEIHKEIPEVYEQNYEYFSENRELIRKKNDSIIYGLAFIFIPLVIGVLVGMFIS